MRNLLHLSMLTELLMGIVLTVLGLGIFKNSIVQISTSKFFPYINDQVLFALFISYVVLIAISLTVKNIFWFRYHKKYNLIDLPIGWFYVIPLTSIFLPSRFLFSFFREKRKDLWGIYILTILYYAAPYILIADALSVGILSEIAFMLGMVLDSDYTFILVFMCYAFTHFAHSFFYKAVKSEIERPAPAEIIEMIGKE